MFFYPFLILMTFCQFNQKKLIYENPHGPTASIVLKEAQKQGIDSRLLFIRLYQENLWNSLSPEELQKWSRAESLKLKNSPEKPENRMDWLLLAARTSLDAYPDRKETDFHLKLQDGLFILDNGNKVLNQKPSVDVLFKSAADNLRDNVIAILLTGMGTDGAEGCACIQEYGGYTIVQNEATSLIFGMPKAAIARGAASIILPLEKIGPFIEIGITT